MWFSRKPRNRRLGREYVLDVKLRSSQVRATRTRMAIAALAVVFATIFGIYIGWRVVEYAFEKLVYKNPGLAVREIVVTTDGDISAEQLRRWAGVKPGDNLLRLDLARVKRDLEMVPLVKFASVERILPHTLRIRVVEREPIAQINVLRPGKSGRLEVAVFHMDAEGWIMLPLEPNQRSAELSAVPTQFPVVAGVNPSEVQAGRRIDTRQVRAALDLLLAFERSAMNGLVDLTRIDVAAPEVLVAATSQGGEVIFGLVDLDQQLRRWRAVFDYGQQSGKCIAHLDLAISNNLPVRWLEASITTPPPPPARTGKNAKTSKKKHV